MTVTKSATPPCCATFLCTVVALIELIVTPHSSACVCALASRAALLSTAVTRNFLHDQAQGEAPGLGSASIRDLRSSMVRAKTVLLTGGLWHCHV